MMKSHKKSGKKWKVNVAYVFFDWKLFFSIQVISADHSMISAIIDTWHSICLFINPYLSIQIKKWCFQHCSVWF